MHVKNAPLSLRCREYASFGGGVRRSFSMVIPRALMRLVMPLPLKSYFPTALNGSPTAELLEEACTTATRIKLTYHACVAVRVQHALALLSR